ncbi:MAG: tRNA (adenosine(37)-N6)-dimethylallyltransferase MiaA [Ferruginibacter sp.]|nr:tRNA (adenosine(37)-N6)-dimethylallyltransferase MiaA [Ferruginibacter sp.]
MKKNTCIIICGPTASGKTDIAVEIARHFKTQIISADSRQCFKELNIGVAKPSGEQLHFVKHYFINSHSITEEVNAVVFEKYAIKAVETIFENNTVAVICGGSGLYIDAFCNGFDEIEEVDTSIKIEILQKYLSLGITWLQDTIKLEDPLFFEKGEIKNPHRMIRALEVIRGTGNSILFYQQKQRKERDFNIIKIGIDIDRELLYKRINQRVDLMIKFGLEKEVRSLVEFKNLNALQTVGYNEFYDFFDNKIPLYRAAELIKQNTRHYAKRQLTWFKKDQTIKWLSSNFIMQKLAKGNLLSHLISI